MTIKALYLGLEDLRVKPEEEVEKTRRRKP